MKENVITLVCEKCGFPQNHIVHMNSIAGDAACPNQTFRPLRPGETSRTVPLWRQIEITLETLALIAVIGGIIWFAS